MKTTQHTPGPWEAINNPHSMFEWEVLTPLEHGARKIMYQGSGSESEHNARLIAEAPSMLKVCELLVDFADHNNRINLDGKLGQAVLAARAVIEGATL